MMTLRRRRKNAWLEVLDVKALMEGSCNSYVVLDFVADVITTVSLVNLEGERGSINFLCIGVKGNKLTGQ